MRRVLVCTSAVVAAFIAVSLSSCDGEMPVSPDASADMTVDGLQAAAQPATHSVTGQGTSWYERGGNEGWMIIALAARQMPDGSVKGNFHWQVRTREWGGRIFVKVSCLTVAGNEARMVGQASQAGNPDNVGKWMGLYVQDNGQGSGALPDRIFQRWFGSFEEEAMLFCAGPRPEDPEPREVLAGNIQVR